MTSPRYLAEHVLMPQFVRDEGATAVLDAIARNEEVFFRPVWMQAGFQFTPILLSHTQGEMRIGILTLPMPREYTEAYLAAVIGKHSDPAFLRYLLWESSENVLDGTPSTVIGEWSADGRHLNHGGGPAFTGELDDDSAAFVERVLGFVDSNA
jgi:hypothetical protein